MIFGRGTRLNVDSNDKYAPSYFYLENQQSRACLAAGFSPHKATLTHELFKTNSTKASEPVQISGDSLFNQVVLVGEDQGDTCDPSRNKTSVCAGTLDKDPTVNSVTLIVLALRLLFFKTVVFNVLMTLRLWMSL
ncbi:M1-specific T cell receptor alpha chain-like [Solea solea]|uniref:M1-specific T cell receptor alpha chain-like n=1 Tax=Solea solea TaxID=90069 RepID=UPI00272A0A02|nr:M1-specific T cell receptor alpha chain-like [Solea solea]